jgi:hypothetical protein
MAYQSQQAFLFVARGERIKFTFTQMPGTNPRHAAFSRKFQGKFQVRGKIVARREYIKLQAATLLDFARSIKNPNVSAVLVEKAADLNDKAESAPQLKDLSPKPPDVELA